MTEDGFDVFTSLIKFYDKTRRRLLQYRTKYPILYDYCNSVELNLSELYDEYRMSGPKGRERKAANLSALCYSVMSSLDAMDDEGFSFLYDEALWPMLRTAITKNELPINHMWIKSLISANILELAINDVLKKFDRMKYDELNKQGVGLDKRFKELNLLLESKGLQKFRLNSIEFDSLKAIRNAVDHPDPTVLNEINEKHVKDTIAYVNYAMKQLGEAYEELKKVQS